MKKITPYKRIDKYAFDECRFADVGAMQEYIRKHGTGNADYVVVGNILYTMEEFDMDGRHIHYHNRRTGNTIEIITDNRYKKGFGDATVTLYENYGVYRNDITFAD